MAKYLDIIEELPKEIQTPILKILQLIREDIANTVTKSDFYELKSVVQDLAEAQKRTEIKVEELAEAQKRTEIKIEELAEAQKQTEYGLHELVKDHKNTKKILGGLSNTIGFHLEDLSYKGLPPLLERDFNLTLKDRLVRKDIIYPDGNYDQVNIYGKGYQNGEEVWIIGECKSQLSKKHIDDFLKLLQRLEIKAGYKKIISFLVSYYSDHLVEEYLASKNIKVYYSYEF